MRVLLLGGPLDGRVVDTLGHEFYLLIAPPCTRVTGDDRLDVTVVPRRHVYGGPLLGHPDRNPNLRALRYQGVRP